jgi:hypothetical protein
MNKYKKTRGNKKYKRKTIKNKTKLKKQIGGELSSQCLKEILAMSFSQNHNLSEQEISTLVNKLVVNKTMLNEWQLLFTLLDQINDSTHLDYDQLTQMADEEVETTVTWHELS